MVEPGRSPFLAVLLTLAACTADYPRAPSPAAGSLRIADGDFDRDPRPVSGREAALDLEVAIRAFDEAYAGVDGAPRLPEPERIAAAREEIQAEGRWMPEALVDRLADLLREPDGHLAFGWDGCSPLRLPAWPLPRPEQAGPPPATGAVALVPGPVPRLVVRTFDSAAAEELAGLPALGRRLRELPAFVVDLRGNGGGNFGFAASFVLELTDAPLRALDEREVVSVAAAEGRSNSARRRLALGEVPPPAEPVFQAHVAALDAEAEALRARGAARAERVVEGGALAGRAPGPLKGRAVFLVDQGCASACEMAVALARQIPGVIIAGEPTRGSMAAGEIALFRLPRSGITLSLGTRAFHDPLGGFAETRGFLPDVPIEGTLAADRAAALAREHDSVGSSRVVSRGPTRVSSRR
jgi:hypothetical protein